MILADKIINLRKKNGMSQEELADKLGVSRQAVSKWESLQSIPDLDKILLMSKLFEVSTDFLLKDEIEMEDFKQAEDDESDRQKVSMEMATEYVNIKFSTAKKIALGVSICILSPIALFILGVLSERYPEKENILCACGLIALLVFVAFAICLFIISGNKVKNYEFLDTEMFETSYGVTGMVKEKKKNLQDTYFKGNLIGVILCVLSVIPLFIGMFSEDDLYMVIGLSTMLFIVSIGVYMIVRVGCQMGALSRLLQEGEYSRKYKANSTITNAFSSCYWSVATIIYLVWSFLSENWNKTWIVWVIAGILYGGLYMIVEALSQKKEK